MDYIAGALSGLALAVFAYFWGRSDMKRKIESGPPRMQVTFSPDAVEFEHRFGPDGARKITMTMSKDLPALDWVSLDLVSGRPEPVPLMTIAEINKHRAGMGLEPIADPEPL